MPDPAAGLGPGATASRISNHLVRLFAQHLGRGPTTARTTLTATFAMVVLEDTLTRGERTLAEAGAGDQVRAGRRVVQAVMHDDVIAGVERETGRRALTYLSDTCPRTGTSVHTVVLAPPAPPV